MSIFNDMTAEVAKIAFEEVYQVLVKLELPGVILGSRIYRGVKYPNTYQRYTRSTKEGFSQENLRDLLAPLAKAVGADIRREHCVYNTGGSLAMYICKIKANTFVFAMKPAKAFNKFHWLVASFGPKDEVHFDFQV